MKDDIGFFSDAMEAVGASDETKKNSMELLKKFLHYDPYKLTKFEFSFKVRDDKVGDYVRLLNMDANGYSCRGDILFLKRVEMFESILKEKGFNNYDKVIEALRGLAKNPMDLYLGFDLKNSDYLFAFWLIFGGVKRSGEVKFWPYDFNSILQKFFDTSKANMPRILKKDIMNLGVDIGRDNLRYKLYYLCREKVMPNHDFTWMMKEINDNFRGLDYFYFFSEMYDEDGNLVKKKLFVEFLKDIMNRKDDLIDKVLGNLSRIEGVDFNHSKLKSILHRCGGRISLISFELDGSLTFYIRPD